MTGDVVREFLPLDVALYSIWMPGDLATAAIQSTRLNPVRTYDEIIELDDVHAACAAYLLRSGAPVFRDAKAHSTYTEALEDRLRQGLAPAAARDAALQESNVGLPWRWLPLPTCGSFAWRIERRRESGILLPPEQAERCLTLQLHKQ